MRAPLSVVIPTLNAESVLPDTLLGLMEGVNAGLIRELVVTDGGSSDTTLAIAAEAGAEIVTGSAGRGGQLIRGAAVAHGEWLLFLHADTQLSPGWADVVWAHLARSEKAAWFRLSFRARGFAPRVVAAWANLRAGFGLPFGDQGLLVSRTLYDVVGGYPDLPLMEDMAMARSLRGRLERLQATALTDASAFQRNGWLRQGGGNIWRQIRFMLGADPKNLAKSYAPSEN